MSEVTSFTVASVVLLNGTDLAKMVVTGLGGLINEVLHKHFFFQNSGLSCIPRHAAVFPLSFRLLLTICLT